MAWPGTLSRKLAHCVALGFALLAAAGALAQPLPIEVVMVPKVAIEGPFALETTIFRPPGDGPFPIALINHGKADGEPRQQPRFEPVSAARFFLERGYAVVAPMRQGFSKSTGKYQGTGCDVGLNGLRQAEDIEATLLWLAGQTWADLARVIVVGQSHGGLAALAYGAGTTAPGVRGLINFAGGLRQKKCKDWQDNLIRGVGQYGARTRLPSLWLYGDNDSYFGPEVFRPMYESYTQAGGQAQLIAYGEFGRDAHRTFASGLGRAIWFPYVTRFLADLGLPTEVLYPQYAPPPPLSPPAASGFATIDDVAAVPYLNERGRAGYAAFLAKPNPRAFALAPTGAWGWGEGGEDPLARALEHCRRNARGDTCKLYAVDDRIVWER
ncbi:MAG: dienelactone hydrolase family protein [Betaproteobacteria bacterium]